MESSATASGVEERYLCPICRDVFESPVYVQRCKHTFCKRCLDQLPPSSASGALSCPVCRLSFLHSDLRRHTTLEQEMTRTSLICTTCHVQCKLLHWQAHSSTHPQAPVPIPPHLAQQHNRPPPPPNRATFSCPLCPQGNLTTSDLLAHVNSHHPNSHTAVVCPICAAMPWGNPDQTSQDFVKHLNMRHNFEYDTYVNYEDEEEAVLQAILRASLTDK